MNAAIRSGAIVAALSPLIWPATALAHGFAKRYDLPIPLWLYLAGAGATVAVSFVLLAVFVKDRLSAGPPRVPSILLPAAGRFLSCPWVVAPLKAFSVGMLFLIIVAGFIGNEDPYRNIGPTFVWVIWWVGMMFVNTFVGDLWAVVNPWNAVFAGAERLARLIKPDARLSLQIPYPDGLGVWPAVALFLAFAWLELVWGEGEEPVKLAQMVAAYSVLTWAGMAVFGRRTWLDRGEAFTAVFTVFARFAPLAFHARGVGAAAACPHGREAAAGEVAGCAACFEDAARNDRALVLRLPGAGLSTTAALPVSAAWLVAVLLATVTFDGVLVTPPWTAYYTFFKELPALKPIWEADWMTLALGFYILATPPLLLFPVLFAGVFLVACRMVKTVTGDARSTPVLARHFALTVVPIAIAYHTAHYLAYLLLTGQYFIPTMSDPFGVGWDLFGTASFKPDIALIDAKFAWYTAVVAIVAGHVIAVFLAHVKAIQLYSARQRALISQLPMLTLMVGYTMLSLWIISQPTVQ
jgi:hypothetical protein